MFSPCSSTFPALFNFFYGCASWKLIPLFVVLGELLQPGDVLAEDVKL